MRRCPEETHMQQQMNLFGCAEPAERKTLPDDSEKRRHPLPEMLARIRQEFL